MIRKFLVISVYNRDMGQRVYYYEHDCVKTGLSISRYRFALPYCKDKTVLDIGCGARKGPLLIAGIAKRVVGLDILSEAVLFSADKWHALNLHYLTSDARRIALKDETFDVVLSFEVIEHVDNYDALLRDAFRVLKSGGVFILSTPNRTVASADGVLSNPDHVREFDCDELRPILARYFKNIDFLGQSLSERAKNINTQKEKNLAMASHVPQGIKKIIPAWRKESLLCFFHAVRMRLAGNFKRGKIADKDFPIEGKNINKATYFVAVCKKA